MLSEQQQSKCDIVYLAKGRQEFTAASLQALAANTNWERVRKLSIYTDGEPMRNGMLGEISCDTLECNTHAHGGPVAIMLYYLTIQSRYSWGPAPAELWAKIDNDVIVPPGWLDACLDVMDANPELDLLGIEPPESRTPAPWAGGKRVPAPERMIPYCDTNPRPGYAPCDSIGGIGMFRTRAWQGRAPMRPHSTYGGFTDWQIEQQRLRHGTEPYPGAGYTTGTTSYNPLVIGWIVPPLKLFLLDRLNIEPWASLSKRYIAEGQQRPWTMYSAAEAESLAGWWLK